MPKMKTTKSAADRFKVTASGKILRAKIGHRHKAMGKSKRNERRGNIPVEVLGVMKKKVRTLLRV